MQKLRSKEQIAIYLGPGSWFCVYGGSIIRLLVVRRPGRGSGGGTEGKNQDHCQQSAVELKTKLREVFIVPGKGPYYDPF